MSKLKQLLDQVDENARELRPGRVVLTVVFAVLFAIGWLVGAVFRAVWLVIAWAWAAAVVGFNTSSGRGDT